MDQQQAAAEAAPDWQSQHQTHATPTQAYDEIIDEAIQHTATMPAQGIQPGYDFFRTWLEPHHPSNARLRRHLVQLRLLTAREFDGFLKRIAHEQRIEAELGGIPKTASELLAFWVSRHSIEVAISGRIMHKRPLRCGNLEVPDDGEVGKSLGNDLARDNSFNLKDLALELRLIRDKLDLRRISDLGIEDAISQWHRDAMRDRKVMIFMNVAYDRHACPREELWQRIEQAAFWRDEGISAGFQIAALKKFIHQVKRKARGLPVENHLMVVLTGDQGGGKSTFVESMLKPLGDAVTRTDFDQIGDVRIVDLWRSPVLFLDEMGGALRADVEVVKAAITAPDLVRRPMRSNSVVRVRQESTFIGCSNNVLADLIKDDTGMRRFAELTFLPQADWEALDGIDWEAIWRSVDEMGPDPMLPFRAELRAQQELVRDVGPVETWARTFKPAGRFGDFTPTAVLYELFREWEPDNFRGWNTSINKFSIKLGSLCQGRNPAWERRQTKKGWEFRYR